MKPEAQDAASSSSLLASNFPNLVLPRKEEIEASVEKSTVCAVHFQLGTIEDDQLRIHVLPGSCLDFSSTAKCKKGMCVYPKETLKYKPEEGHAVYIWQVGLPQQQAESLQSEIKIYVAARSGRDGLQKILVGHLSKEHSEFRLGMVLPTEFELSHSSLRKNVYFNAFELKCRLRVTGKKESCELDPQKLNKIFPKVYKYHLKTNKDIWVAEVSPSKKSVFRPTVMGKVYNLLRIFLKTSSKENIELFVETKDSRKSVGAISDEKPSIDCEFEFDDTFRLYHSSRASVVIFWGYTISYDVSTSFKLQDLTSDPAPFVKLLQPKNIVDEEHNAYQALLVKKKSGANMKRVNLVPMLAPVIRFPKGVLSKSSEDKDADAGGSIGH